MKKTLLLACLTIACAATMTSCKKDYTCTCKTTMTGVTAGGEIKDAKKKDAEAACDAWQTQLRVVDANASCSL